MTQRGSMSRSMDYLMDGCEGAQSLHNDLLWCAPESTTQAIRHAVRDGSSAANALDDVVRSLFRHAAHEKTSFDELIPWLQSIPWPVALGFQMGQLAGDLGALQLGSGIAAVARLAPVRGTLGYYAVALASSHPGELFDPMGTGRWRAPTPLDEARWQQGGRHVLMVRCAMSRTSSHC